MDIPRILEHLNDFHQNQNDQSKIPDFSLELKHLLAESNKILSSVGTDVSWNSMISRINDLLPKPPNHKEINFFSLLAAYANSARLNINIPATLIKSESLPSFMLIKANQNNLIESRECTENEFFSFTNESNSVGYPCYCYKNSNKEITVAFSKETVAKLWKSAGDNSLIQFFIQSNANPASVTRVLWRKGEKNKYFTIINKKLATKKELHHHHSSSLSTKKSKHAICRYSATQWPIATSSNPIKHFPIRMKNDKNLPDLHASCKLKNKAHKDDIFKTFGNDTKSVRSYDNLAEVNIAAHTNNFKEYIVDTKNIASCVASESFVKIDDIELMVEQIADFFTYHVFKKTVKGLVLDFVKDINNKWFLLDCREHWIDQSMPLEKTKRIKLPLKISGIDTSDRSQTTETRTSDINHPNCAKIMLRVDRLNLAKKRKESIKMKNIYEKFKQMNEKIDCLNTQKSTKNQDINVEFSPIIQDEAACLKTCKNFVPILDLTPISTSRSKNRDQSPSNDPFICTKMRYFSEAAEQNEELKQSVNKIKKKRESLMNKYGGEGFWSKFIISLYNKVLGCEILNKYFKDSKIESFQGIVKGMFRIFSGNLNLELRGRLRTAHHNYGINEREFNCYAEMFYLTLSEFQVSQDDIQGIMSQLGAMKSLICKEI
ncbi:unnamed protein product [Blepharisma stoltei]|uniref:Globin family profile domain-containing protein n=1 Tax=Blepharisma stoltei TaxID=1481888 RepID=A0AAU9J9V4_9CILI|nr:unnamed protein product [Blepharisma stoltei]